VCVCVCVCVAFSHCCSQSHPSVTRATVTGEVVCVLMRSHTLWFDAAETEGTDQT
jgi:hypothetical protein